MKLLRALLIAGALLLPSAAFAGTCSSTLSIKDGAGASQTLAESTDGTNLAPCVSQIGATPTTVTLQSAAVANGNGTTLTTTGMATATLTVNCVSCSGGTTVNFEGTEDGTNYSSLNAALLGSNSLGTSTQASGLTYWLVTVSNLQNIRARISGYSAGTVTVTGHTSAVAGPSHTIKLVPGGQIDILGNAGSVLDATLAAGSAPPNGIGILGQYNTTLPSPTNTQTVALQVDASGRLLTATSDPCAGGAKTVKPINNAGSSSNLLLVTGTASKKVYVCSINVGPVASAVNVALVEGTTTTNACDTGTAGMAGGATAATGWQFSANGGLTFGSGAGTVALTATNADNVCLWFSGGVQVSGVMTYVVQ